MKVDATNWGHSIADAFSRQNKRHKLGFKRLSDGAILPTRAHETDSGFDLYASEDVVIEPGETVVIKTDIAVKLPSGHEAQVRPRSGVTSETKLRVQLGTIDEGYNGAIGVIVDNIARRMDSPYGYLGHVSVYTIDGESARMGKPYDRGTYLVRKGNRIAQLVVQPLPSLETYEITGDLDETERGSGGFGSTGMGEREGD